MREGVTPPGENALGLEEDDGVLDEELQHLLKHGLGGTAGFTPTQEWVTSWQKACVPPHCSMLFAGGLISKETPHPFPSLQAPTRPDPPHHLGAPAEG